MKILIAEDHPVFRDISRKIISDWFPHATAVCAPDGATAIQLLREHNFSHMLLALQLPDMDGFAVADIAVGLIPDIRIITATSHCTTYTIWQAEKRGIRGFVDKRISTAFNFHQAIANVEADITYFSPTFQRLKAERQMNPLSFDKILSDREIEILAYIAAPYSDIEIAMELSISPGTVEKHRFNMLRKLELPTTFELIRYARIHGIVHPPTETLSHPVLHPLKAS